MQLCEEEDDASSPLAAPKPEPNDQTLQAGGKVMFQEVSVFYLFVDKSSIFCDNHFCRSVWINWFWKFLCFYSDYYFNLIYKSQMLLKCLIR